MSWQFASDYRNKKPHPSLCAIKYNQNQWVLVMNHGDEARYDTLNVLIHNPLFQLIKYGCAQKNKFLILFNDQITKDELRLIHLKSSDY